MTRVYETDSKINPKFFYFNHDGVIVFPFFFSFFGLALRVLSSQGLSPIHNAGHLNEQTFGIVLYRPHVDSGFQFLKLDVMGILTRPGYTSEKTF